MGFRDAWAPAVGTTVTLHLSHPRLRHLVLLPFIRAVLRSISMAHYILQSSRLSYFLQGLCRTFKSNTWSIRNCCVLLSSVRRPLTIGCFCVQTSPRRANNESPIPENIIVPVLPRHGGHVRAFSPQPQQCTELIHSQPSRLWPQKQ